MKPKSQPHIRLMLRSVIAIGPGKADLIDAIEKTGSISAAAREMGMSYRRAWMLVDDMNSCFVEPIVETVTGGKGGGGARVTDFGKDVIRRYHTLEARATRAVTKQLAEFSKIMVEPARRK